MWFSKLTGRRHRARTKDTLAWIEGLHVCAAPLEGRAVPAPTPAPVRSEQTSGSPAVSRRVLELQVRSLETALEEQHQRTEDVRLTVEGQFAVAGRRDQERAVLTVQALRSVLAGQDGIEAANRVEAALNRMGAEPSFVRPVLAASPSGSPAVTLHSLQVLPPPCHASAPPAPALPPAVAPVHPRAIAEDPSNAPAGAPVPQPEAVQPDQSGPDVPATPAEPRPVLPVPPPRTTAPAPRKGRMLRRTVAA